MEALPGVPKREQSVVALGASGSPLGPVRCSSTAEKGFAELNHEVVMSAIGKVGETGQRALYASTDAAGKLSVPSDPITVGL